MRTPQFYGKASDVAETILRAFQEPSRLPEALAPIFIRRRDSVPCAAWSWSNQLIVALHGHSEARGYRQWQQVNRHVREGEKAIHILAPVTRKVMENDEERLVAVGFRAMPGFGLGQTDGEPVPTGDEAVDAWLVSLPLREVAEECGIGVQAFNGGRRLGSFRPGQIALGVQNLST